ncbi:MAG: NADPH-dependent F420 reductase, partial [Acetobacteraceae bacterium]
AKAEAAARAIPIPAGFPLPCGLTQTEAAACADVIVLSVPFAAHAAALDAIRPACAGKIVVDATVPLVPPKTGTAQIPPEGCAAVQARERLGEGVTVVSAFHNISAKKLAGTEAIDCDVLVFGDVRAARETVIRLAEAAGLRALHGGPLANSIAAEALTSVLITINRLYKVQGAGIRITGPGGDGGLA